LVRWNRIYKKYSSNRYFNDEIEPVIINSKLTPITIDQDERPLRLEINKISQLKPAFKTNGTVTAANSSGIADGAAAVVLMSESEAKKRHITPLARIIGHQSHAQKPAWFTTAPILAIEKLLKQQDLTGDEIDLFEINEAFAVVVMAAIQKLHLDINKVNIHGGACALGHPIGASGARIIVTLLSALQQYNLKLGLAALCIGGGEATAMLISK
jgi:acetyl-CoA C-acetyltransferase